MQNWIYPFVLWLVVAYRMKSQLFRMFLFYSLLFSLTCFISTSDPLFYFGQPTSVCCRWGTMRDLSDRFPKDLFFLCDPGSIYVLVPQLWSAGTANSTVVSYLFVPFTLRSLCLISSSQSTWSSWNAGCSLSSRYWYMLFHPLGMHFPESSLRCSSVQMLAPSGSFCC